LPPKEVLPAIFRACDFDSGEASILEKRYQREKEIELKAALNTANTFGQIIRAGMELRRVDDEEFGIRVASAGGKKKPFTDSTIQTWKWDAHMPREITTLKAVIEVLELPRAIAQKLEKIWWKERDMMWKESLKEADTFGGVFKAHRNLSHMTKAEFGKNLGLELSKKKPVPIRTIRTWEEETDPPKNIKILNAAIKLLGLKKDEAEKLQEKWWERRDIKWRQKLSDAEDFGDMVKCLRNLKHLEQDELAVEIAEVVGSERTIHRTTVGKWENGVVPRDDRIIEVMAQLFGLNKEEKDEFFRAAEKKRAETEADRVEGWHKSRQGTAEQGKGGFTSHVERKSIKPVDILEEQNKAAITDWRKTVTIA